MLMLILILTPQFLQRKRRGGVASIDASVPGNVGILDGIGTIYLAAAAAITVTAVAAITVTADALLGSTAAGNGDSMTVQRAKAAQDHTLRLRHTFGLSASLSLSLDPDLSLALQIQVTVPHSAGIGSIDIGIGSIDIGNIVSPWPMANRFGENNLATPSRSATVSKSQRSLSLLLLLL